MIPEIGYIALIAALFLTVMQVCPSFCRLKLSSGLIFGLMLLSFGCLMFSYAVSDFSVLNVYNNSHTAKPFIYKLTGTWGNHEGSMLLLALILSAYSAAFTAFGNIGQTIKTKIVKIQGLVNSCFLSFIIFTSNPFERIVPAPENGLGLNPLLQDVGLAIHPPLLYVGYIGFSIAFAFAIAALLEEKAGREWANALKKWTLFSWSFLTLGIGMGSWWAYRELGWGGIWFWDPVENSSLIPWLSATALLHSLLVMEKRDSLTIWTILLAILTFIFSLMGIFLVRSGILTSVHSFANDPARGMFILGFLGITIFIALLLFATKAHKLSGKNNFALLSKEGSIVINNFLLSVAFATVILGTLYPIFTEILSNVHVSVGAPYFNTIMPPITLLLLVLAAIAPSLKWQKDSFKSINKIVIIPLIVGAITAALVFSKTDSITAILALSCSAWLTAAMLILLWQKSEGGKKIGKLPATFLGMITAHIGAAVLITGITVSVTMGVEKEEILKHSEFIELADYKVTMGDMYIFGQDNFLTREGVFTITNTHGDELAILKPQVRFYPVEQTNTTEAAIYYSLLSNIYIAMGGSDDKGGFVVRVYYKPLVNLVWLGCLLMFSGGIIALRRKK